MADMAGDRDTVEVDRNKTEIPSYHWNIIDNGYWIMDLIIGI